MKLVSIFCVVKNGAKSIRRCIKSVLEQEWKNLEFVVQDGASSDGTFEIFQSYNDDRIKWISEPDSGPEEAFFKALKRCKGEVIGCCTADEELMPGAIEWAMKAFEKHLQAAAVYGDSQNIDLEEKPLTIYRPHPEFTTEKYLLHEVVPCFGASFFKREAVERAGVGTREWRTGCGEFEFWLQVSLQGEVKYEPGIVSKFTVHSGQRSRTREVHNRMIQSRIKIINQLYEDEAFKKKMTATKERVLAGVFLWAAQMANESGDDQDAINYVNRALPYKPNDRRLEEFAGDICEHGVRMLKEKKWERALQSFDCALHGGGASPDIHFLRANVLDKLDRRAEAVEAVEKHLEKNPKDEIARQWLNQLKG